MKKLLAFLSAACLVVTLSVPVFAATSGQIDSSATNGQPTPPAVEDLLKDIGNPDKLETAIKAFVDNKALTMNALSTNALMSAIKAQSGSKAIAPVVAATVATAIDTIAAYAGSETANAALSVNSATFENGVLELDMSYKVDGVAKQPKYGVLIDVKLKNPMAYDSSKTYTWKNDAGMQGIAVPYVVNNKIVSYEFVAPHFSKYVISVATPAPTPAPATPSAVAPAKTGASTNFTAMAVMLAGAVALAGVAMFGKKAEVK